LEVGLASIIKVVVNPRKGFCCREMRDQGLRYALLGEQNGTNTDSPMMISSGKRGQTGSHQEASDCPKDEISPQGSMNGAKKTESQREGP